MAFWVKVTLMVGLHNSTIFLFSLWVNVRGSNRECNQSPNNALFSDIFKSAGHWTLFESSFILTSVHLHLAYSVISEKEISRWIVVFIVSINSGKALFSKAKLRFVSVHCLENTPIQQSAGKGEMSSAYRSTVLLVQRELWNVKVCPVKPCFVFSLCFQVWLKLFAFEKQK